MMRRSTFHALVALLLATNYFAFQAEVFEEEYENNHPERPEGLAFTHSGLSWESFDKENAPQALVFDAGIRIDVLFTLPPVVLPPACTEQPRQPVRDKSPPPAFPLTGPGA
jgi:hypothetical protein